MPGLARVIPTREFALYSLSGPSPAANGTYPLPFSPARYSRYKYGSVTAAETFARVLGAAFCERHPELVLAPRLLLASSAYSHVPAAATTLARRLQPVLNDTRGPFTAVVLAGSSGAGSSDTEWCITSPSFTASGASAQM